MKEEYYIPDIEDIKVGYECFWILDLTKSEAIENFLPMKFTPKQTAFTLFSPFNWEREETDNIIPNLMSYRTPFLTEEQIEQEGWKKQTDVHFEKGDHTIKIYRGKTWIPFHILIEGHGQVYFFGECKSINEFRYILKLLNIK